MNIKLKVGNNFKKKIMIITVLFIHQMLHSQKNGHKPFFIKNLKNQIILKNIQIKY